MAEILHQLIGSLSVYTSQVVQEFFHQQYHPKFDHNSSTVRSNREASLPGEPSPKQLSNRHEAVRNWSKNTSMSTFVAKTMEYAPMCEPETNWQNFA